MLRSKSHIDQYHNYQYDVLIQPSSKRYRSEILIVLTLIWHSKPQNVNKTCLRVVYNYVKTNHKIRNHSRCWKSSVLDAHLSSRWVVTSIYSKP